ncbi:MAG: class I SAM-dependent methyltransferase, partial [Planctomycetes bacterium]|nr:class I SAM-dependent methyltransferase [Planctomycetota bacterium]
QADALMLPFRDGQFDVAAVAFGVRNFSSLPLGLAEMGRVVRGGGGTVVLEFSRPSGPVFGRIHDFYIRRVLPLVARVFFRGRIDAYKYLPRSIMGFLDERELAEEMGKCGLTDMDVQRLTLGTVCAYIGTKGEEEQ